ncbi:MAG: LysR family transcriptional regulator [Moraxella sp.]|nr:LysR family transcriptional regulator [Moraxella sp.]
MRFELTDLRVFVAIATAPSLTQGAKAVYLSPAAASNRMKNLETQLGGRLFYRNNKGMELTPAGKDMLVHARKILTGADELIYHFSEANQDQQGHLKIYANTTAVIGFLPEILASFLADRPRVSIDLKEEFTKNIIRGVREESADFGIVSGVIEALDLEHIHISTDRLCVAVPINHDLAELECVSLDVALRYSHIGFHAGSTLQKYLDDHKDRLGITTKSRINVQGFESVCRLIEAGVGIGVIPESVMDRHSRTMAIKSIHLNEKTALRERSIIVKRYDSLSPVARALIESIKLHQWTACDTKIY